MREDDVLTGVGREPTDRRQAVIKLMWVGIWMAYMTAPVNDLQDGGHRPLATALGCLGLLVFLTAYCMLLFRHVHRPLDYRRVGGALVTMAALAAALALTLGASWLVLFVYVSVACGAVLPIRVARLAIPLATVVLLLVGLTARDARHLLPALVIPALLGGFAMSGVRQLVRTTRALREARATVAQLAANEERLRLARDLHDLLGHSLSLITLKSELAGRLLSDRPEQAGQQVADIERVSRQALVDVREAVSGFRRPTLEAEVAGARIALTAAGIAADLGRAADGHPDLPPDEEGALAWALREGITNVVRHSGARRCTVTLTEAGDELCLTISDDGRGPEGPPGNGLSGLSERLQLAGGRLETGSGERGGFALRAYVPLSRRATAPELAPATPG
ncbi:sensor histidine kinase [Streptomyces sp. ME19-01-6]|uniref:sensor histidine kinase n=1 Tax=Streptomyces sp. ME19-01-6 TaxID=3028686 RepID=UPI0029AE3DBD|nr:sensor histidine kinase [Streptomyces sp. ME19-01-6]MDX3225782.1 sensor histidine kinase [Streptomyces sp. ME19-01-6]